MSSSSSSPPPPQAAAASSSTSMITKGSIVTVESRTWPGLNKPGGVARVTHVHHNDDTNKITYDVAYVLGGKEKAVDAEYVTLQSADDDGDGTKKKRTSAGGGLTISTSTASLALSATPLQTPRSPKSNEKEVTNNNNDNDDSDGTPIDDNEEQIIEERRKRKNSITENILMGMTAEGESIELRDDSRNSSYSELPNATTDDAPLVKKMKLETSEQHQQHDKTDDESSSMSLSSLHNHHKTAIWSARKNLEIRVPAAGRTADDSNNTATSITTTTTKRWRSHQIAEDYITLASALVLPPPTTSITYGYSPHFGQYPIEQMTALGYLTSPLRRPTIIEKWSPYEIATFEASMALHGKHFHIISKFVKTKSTKEIIEFYYIWKKTSHYRRWKNGFEDEICESVDGSSSEEEENDDGGGDGKGGDDKK
ncbi:hypothetical protein ACHAWC_005492 [Mediolabrus comicus]